MKPAASEPDDAAWIEAGAVLESLTPELRDVVWAAALPHWFDAEILAALQPKHAVTAEERYRLLRTLPFVHEHLQGGHTIRAEVRDHLLDELWANQRDTYVAWSARLADHFGAILIGPAPVVGPWSGLIEQPVIRTVRVWLRRRRHAGFVRSTSAAVRLRVEQLYHAIIARPSWARDTIVSQGLGWLREHEPSPTTVKALADAIAEQARAGRAPVKVKQWGWFFSAEVAHLNFDAARAKRLLIRVVAQTSDDWLRANAAFALGMRHRETWALGKARPSVRLALSYYEAWNNMAGQANCHWLLGYLDHLDHRHDAARRAVLRALSLLRRPDSDLHAQANCYWTLGEIEADRQAHTAARAYYERARALYARSGSRLGICNTLNSLGWLALQRDQTAIAQRYYVESLELAEALNARLTIANLQTDLGRVHEQLRAFDAAADHYTRADAGHLAIQNPLDAANARIRLARIERIRHRRVEAQAALDSGLADCRAIGRPVSLGLGLIEAATVRLAREDFAEAVQHLHEALRCAIAGHALDLQAACHLQLARVQCVRGELDQAETTLRAAEACLEHEPDYTLSRAAQRAVAAALAVARGDLEGARAHVLAAAAFYKEAGVEGHEPWRERALGELAVLGGDIQAGADHVAVAWRLAAEADDAYERLACLENQAWLHTLRGDHAAAVSRYDEAIAAGAYPAASLFLERAHVQRRVGDLAAMARDLEAAARADASPSPLAYGRARLALASGEPEAACVALADILERWPHALVVHVALGRAHLAAGRPDQALTVLRAGLEQATIGPTFAVYVDLRLEIRELQATTGPDASVAHLMAGLIAERIGVSTSGG